MRILFLHGLESQVGGAKPEHLKAAGFDVVEPSLAGTSFEESKIIAQAYVEKYRPEVIVGSSRGGALAMSVDPAAARLVLVAPAWNIYGSPPGIRADSTIIHSEADKVIPFEESIQLSEMSGAPLVSAGSDHRMNDSSALSALLGAVERQLHWVNLRIGDRVVSRAGKVGVIVSTMKIDGELLYVVTWRESKTATACKKQELGLLHGRY